MELFAKWLPYILAGVSLGGQYALIAIGYTMVYGILRLINFAHGDMFMMAGLVMIYLVSALPIWLSVIVVIAPSKKWLIVRCAPRRECRS